jgi:hypothetical protein
MNTFSFKLSVFSFQFLGLMLWASADELVLRDGETLTGVILKTDGKTVTLRMSASVGQAEVAYPVAHIKVIRFRQEVDNLEKVEQLHEMWEKRLPYLSLAESDSGSVGLRYAKALLERKTKKAAVEALAIAQTVEQSDWMLARRSEATRLRLSALAASGRVEQAMAEAEKIQDISAADESSLAFTRVQTRFLQSELALSKWLELEKEWPKWRLMPDKRKERTELLNQVLDGFLFPVVFHPELLRCCAEGLYRVAELHVKWNDPESALLYANEIIKEYPDMEFKTKAEKLIKDNKLGSLKN